jgi:phosphate:Na+ symporter
MHNRADFRNSAEDSKYNQYTNLRKQLEAFYYEIDLTLTEKNSDRGKNFMRLLTIAHDQYFERQKEIYAAAANHTMPEADLSSLLNVNRELYTSCKTIVQAMLLLYEGRAAHASRIGDLP